MSRYVWLWLLFLALVPAEYAWLKPDITTGAELSIVLKLLAVAAFGAICATVGVASYARRWRQGCIRLEDFATALPAMETQLPEDGPGEMQGLARAMKGMAERVWHVVERANVELSRRETILACMAEGVLTVDKDLRVMFCNDAFAQAFSTRVPAREGRSLYEVVREPLLRDILERVVQTGTAEKDRFQLPSAAGRWFEARALPIGDQPRRGAVIVLHDVTDIERQEQVRKDFVADVSHELRTPLAAIRGYTETLLDGAIEDSENNRKFLEVILSHTIRLSNISADLLVISELDSNAQPAVPPERVPVKDVIESALHSVESAAALKGVNLIADNCYDCTVMGYRFRLEQAMVNLLDNAVKFNRNGGRVEVDCGPAENGQVQITVSDTGIGIPSEDLKRVFERFYRVDKARSRPVGGTGLGLPIVKEVVERMGGTVSVESQLGKGSRFTLLLKTA